jgi:FAD/FMN-containing dehydrogenase
MKVVWRRDEEYEALRRELVWNLRVPPRYPDVIVRAANEHDVVDAVKLAREYRLRIKVRGTGHSRSASFLREDGMLLDLSALNGMSIDPASRTATVEPGVVAGVFNPALIEKGLFFPTAHEPEVGMGGYVMSGGIGWIAARHGLGCANLQGIDLVTAEGELIHSDDGTNPEYIWAARGAGPGFFGVVTRFHLGVHPLPSAIRMSSYSYPMAIWEEVWTWAMEITHDLPRDVAANIGMPRKAGGPFSDDVPSVILNAAAMSDTAEAAEAGLRILESCPYVDHAVIRQVAVPKTVSELFTWADALQPSGLRYGLDNMWTDAEPAQLFPYLREVLADMPNGLSNIHAHMWHHPQTVANSALTDQGRLLLSLFGLWQDDADEAKVMEWITGHLGRMEPLSKGLMIAEEELVLRPRADVLSAENMARYEELRARLDPDGMFHTFPGATDQSALASTA